MLTILICVGSSCHLKGSHKIVERLEELIKKYNIEDHVILSGSFCAGKCNRNGVTIKINDEFFTGVTPDSFDSFFKEHILDIVLNKNKEV
ncbi:MAG: (2Fe-2S) ferredoxin domain-containing protein [Oscillospiraceae bacterium]|nr:(2Fe-2S) ferredoxin domain-containing protein [Oscillospiraceae bacterium]